MKKALIIGSSGQDGRLLKQFLEDQSWTVEGIDQDSRYRIETLSDVEQVISQVQPDKIFFLAAIHHSSEHQTPETLVEIRRMYEINSFALMNFLECLRLRASGARLFYAASSHLFRPRSGNEQHTEEACFQPDNVYAMTKAAGVWACRFYRQTYGVQASTGILYNHESSLRSPHFLSKKICTAIARIQNGETVELRLGDLEARVDWGFAEDYVRAFHLITELPQADDFIVATGQAHSVQEFVEKCFNYAGLDWKKYVVEDAGQVRKASKGAGFARIGNASKLMNATGWKPSLSFEQMIVRLLQAEGVVEREI